MTPRGYDRYMIDVEIGSNAKIGRFTAAQFQCLVCGVWPLAAKSQPRGCLVVAGQPAIDADIARQARCSTAVARSTLALMRDLLMLETDDETGLEYVHDWHDFNPDPKRSDTPEGWRERKRRQRSKAKPADVTRDMGVTSRDSHAPEVEGEVEPEETASLSVVLDDAPTPDAQPVHREADIDPDPNDDGIPF